MKMYKISDSDDYILFNNRDLRRVFLLNKIEKTDVELDNNMPIQFKGNKVKEVDINEEDLFSYLYLPQEQLKGEIIYNKKENDYLYSIRQGNKPYQVVRRVRDIDYLLEDNYLKEKIEEKVKNNWNSIIEKADDKTIMKYFNEDKFKDEVFNSFSLNGELIKTDLGFDIKKLEKIIQDFDFDMEEDKSKALELLDKEIKEKLDNFNVDIDIKGLIKSNPDFFDLDRLIKGEEDIILEVFEELELEKDGHKIKLEVHKDIDITQQIIEELSKNKIIDKEDPTVDNKEFTQSYLQRRKEEEEMIRRINYDSFMEL